MPEIYDDPQDQPRVEEAFEPSGEDAAVEAYNREHQPPRRGVEKIDVPFRVSQFDEASMRFAPDTVGHVVTQLPTDNQTAGWIGNLMSDAVPYLQNYFQFSGVPGQLLRARRYINNIADPNLREAGKRFLAAIQALPEDQQVALMFYLQGYRAVRDTERVTQLQRAPNVDPNYKEAARAADLLGQNISSDINFGISTGELSADFDIYDTNVQMTQEQGFGMEGILNEREFLAHMERLFPGLNIAEIDPGILERTAEGSADWLMDHSGPEALLNTTFDILSQRSEDGKPYNLGMLGVDALRILGQSSYAAGDVGFDIAGTVTRKIPLVGDEIADFAGDQARAAEKALTKAIEPVVTAGLKPTSRDPVTGDPIYSLADQRVIEARAGAFVILTGLVSYGTGSLIGKAGRRVRTVRRAAGRQAAEDVLAAKRGTRRTGPLGTAAELYRAPIRVVTREIDRQLVRLARNPEEWFASRLHGRQGRLLIQTLNAAKKKYPGTGKDAVSQQLGFVKAAYGSQLPDRMVRMMLRETSDQGARRVFMDTIMNSEAGTRTINQLKRQRSRVRTSLRELEHPEMLESRAQRLANAEARFNRLREEGRSPDVPENVGHELIQVRREIDRIRGEENSIVQLRARELDLDWRIKTTFDDDPVLRYPKQNIIRAAVQYAPVTRFSKFVNAVFVRSPLTLKFDPAKLTDEIGRFPEVFVPGTHNAPIDQLRRNSDTLSTYMRRAGVDPETVHLRIGQLGEMKNQTDFYDFVEKTIFGEGGDIDKALHGSVSPELRSRLINLHDTPIETRTFSNFSEKVVDQYGTTRIQRAVLGREGPDGDEIPLPSRPTEFLQSIRLPDIDRVIEADSWISRGVSRLERHGKVSGAAYMSVWRVPKFLLRGSTMIMKPLVMLVRLPAMMMRIQMEQALRASNFGYKPWKGLPEGLSLFPGGIPIPTVHAVRVMRDLFKPGRTKLFGITRTGDTALGRTRAHRALFKEEGWRLLDPDERFENFTSPDSWDIGMFASEMMDDFPVERVWESTYEFRTGRRAPKTAEWEAYRKELAQAHSDFIDRKLAQLDLDVDRFLQWLQRDVRAGRFVEVELKPQLEIAFPPGGRQGVPDGFEFQMPARDAATYVEFPHQLTRGRSPEYMDELRSSLADGYDASLIPEGGTQPVGSIEMEFNPRTGEAMIREGHHRIGILAEMNETIPVRIKRVNRIERTSVGREAGDVTPNEFDELIRDLTDGEGEGMFGPIRGPVEESGPLFRSQVLFRGKQSTARRYSDGTQEWYKGLFATHQKSQAELYADHPTNVETLRLKKGSRVLVEGTPEYNQIVRTFDDSGNPDYPRLDADANRQFLDNLTVSARRRGYDAIQMHDPLLGTNILNRSAIERNVADKLIGREPSSVGSLLRGLNDEESSQVLAALARIREARAATELRIGEGFTPRYFGWKAQRVPETMLARDKAPVADPLREWAGRRVQYLRSLTKDNPDMLATVATGKTRAHSRFGSDLAEDGSSIHAKYDNLVEKVDTISASIRDLVADRSVDNTHKIVALQGEKLDALKRIDRLTRENPELNRGMKTFDINDKRRWRNHIAEQWAERRMELPDRLLVDKRLRGVSHDGGRLDDAERLLGSLNTLLYRPFKLLTYADEHGTRGSLFTRLYRENVDVLQRRGYDSKTAAAIAHARAAERTRDIMYDLSARTSVQRGFRDIMWFAPAWQEVLYTWFVKIPSEAYWVPGMTQLALKASGLLQMLEGAGVMREDANGEKVLIIPGMENFIEKVTGKKVPSIVFGKLSGLNLVTTSPIPGLSTGANFLLGEAALKHGGIFKDLSDVFQPYGPETAVLPTPIVFLWEAVLGSPPPFEPLGADKLKQDWDRSMDIGIQYAYSELQAAGVMPPRPEDYGTRHEDGTWTVTDPQQDAYERDSAAYITELMDLGKEYQQGIAFVRLVGSTVTPMQLYATSKEREQWEKFWNTFIVPQGFGDEGLKQRQRDLIDQYIEQNPNSFAYSVYYRGQGEQVRELPFAESLDDNFYDAFYTGESINLTPRQFSQKLMATEARRYYQAEYERALREISPTMDPWALLTKGFEKKEALTDYLDKWENWRFMNPQHAALLDSQSALWKKNNDVPTESWASERIARTLQYFRMLSGQLTGEEKVRPQFVRDTLRELGVLYSQEGEFGVARTAEEKQLEWYFSNVYEPYLNEVIPLYEKAQEMDAAGLNAGDVYDQIRRIQNQSTKNYKGVPAPAPEAVSFGNRSPFERQAAIWGWRTRPINWLSDFQMDKAGWGNDPAVRSFLDQVSAYDADMWDDINAREVHPASKEWDDIMAERDRFLMQQAQRGGPSVVNLWNLSEAPPVFKLQHFGFGDTVPEWGRIVDGAQSIIGFIQADPDDLSIKGFSEKASYYKAYFYRAITQSRAENKALDDLFDNLAYSFPLPDGTYRRDATLYEAVFFGNFNTDFIPFDVADAASDLV